MRAVEADSMCPLLHGLAWCAYEGPLDDWVTLCAWATLALVVEVALTSGVAVRSLRHATGPRRDIVMRTTVAALFTAWAAGAWALTAWLSEYNGHPAVTGIPGTVLGVEYTPGKARNILALREVTLAPAEHALWAILCLLALGTLLTLVSLVFMGRGNRRRPAQVL
jgi:hypothetical protein